MRSDTDTERLQEFRRRIRNWLRTERALLPEPVRYEALQQAALAVADAMYDAGMADAVPRTEGE